MLVKSKKNGGTWDGTIKKNVPGEIRKILIFLKKKKNNDVNER